MTIEYSEQFVIARNHLRQEFIARIPDVKCCGHLLDAMNELLDIAFIEGEQSIIKSQLKRLKGESHGREGQEAGPGPAGV